jgi:SPW repeat
MWGDVTSGVVCTRRAAFDLCKLACAAALFCSPWMLELSPIPAWNLWCCGYAMLTIIVADLTAEADWEPRTSLYLGAWLAAAPWLLGFSQDGAAMLLHVAGGGVISLLSAAELWSAQGNPPWRFRPASARRAIPEPLINDIGGSHEILPEDARRRGPSATTSWSWGKRLPPRARRRPIDGFGCGQRTGSRRPADVGDARRRHVRRASRLSPTCGASRRIAVGSSLQIRTRPFALRRSPA